MIILVHGGPVAEPADAEFVIKNTRHCHGFYGASSMERLPVEVALTRADAEIQGHQPRLNGPCDSTFVDGRTDMSGQLIGALILWLIVAIIVIAIVVYLVNWLYRRSSKEAAFVRTGLFGEKVVINGGAFVLPFIHDITPVNMNVLQMRVMRGQDDALITKDRMRVDIDAEFYVRVRADRRGGVARRRDARPAHHAAGDAARAVVRQVRLGAALGRLRDDDGGDARAARRLSSRRSSEAAAEALAKNGLELESVALTDLDQTDLRILQPLEPLRRRRPDPSDRGDRGPAQDCATTSSRTR